MPETYKPGTEVPKSGIYRVLHDPAHTPPHEVTVVYGKRFPPCRTCLHPVFELVRAARHVDSSKYFKP